MDYTTTSPPSPSCIKRFFVLDKSGSMDSIAKDTIGGYNAFVNDQKEFGGTMSLMLFDNTIETLYEDVDINQIERLTHKSYVPRGTTALYDAIGTCIKKIENFEYTSDVTIKVIILTDGEDNSSKKYSSHQIKELITTKTSVGWDFMFLGADQDAVCAAAHLGIDMDNTLAFDSHEIDTAFRCLSAVMSQQAQGRAASIQQYSSQNQSSVNHP